MYCSSTLITCAADKTTNAKTTSCKSCFILRLSLTMASTILPVITEGKSPNTADTISAANTAINCHLYGFK